MARETRPPSRPVGRQTGLHGLGLAVGYSSDSGVICSTSETIARRTFGSRTRVPRQQGLSAKVFDELFCQFDFEWYSRLLRRPAASGSFPDDRARRGLSTFAKSNGHRSLRIAASALVVCDRVRSFTLNGSERGRQQHRVLGRLVAFRTHPAGILGAGTGSGLRHDMCVIQFITWRPHHARARRPRRRAAARATRAHRARRARHSRHTIEPLDRFWHQ